MPKVQKLQSVEYWHVQDIEADGDGGDVNFAQNREVDKKPNDYITGKKPGRCDAIMIPISEIEKVQKNRDGKAQNDHHTLVKVTEKISLISPNDTTSVEHPGHPSGSNADQK